MTASGGPPQAFVHGTRFSAGQWSAQRSAMRDEISERDTLFRSGEREFAREYPDARVEPIPRVRHPAGSYSPAVFTGAVRRFAREVRP
ncbi:hypothetical protein [Streptomyces djakartensis]|uniref:hypothetical protein n=1 Tax=Streptomyces djakartensis TaxID=68193 RepID=UPI0034DE283C